MMLLTFKGSRSFWIFNLISKEDLELELPSDFIDPGIIVVNQFCTDKIFIGLDMVFLQKDRAVCCFYELFHEPLSMKSLVTFQLTKT